MDNAVKLLPGATSKKLQATSFPKFLAPVKIDKYAPSARTVEIVSKRTINSKYYVDKDTASKFYLVQSSGALHYWKDGQWLTIDEHLEKKSNQLFEASCQQEPVGFDMGKQMSYIKSTKGNA